MYVSVCECVYVCVCVCAGMRAYVHAYVCVCVASIHLDAEYSKFIVSSSPLLTNLEIIFSKIVLNDLHHFSKRQQFQMVIFLNCKSSAKEDVERHL